MATNQSKYNRQDTWAELTKALEQSIPQLNALFTNEDDFREIRLKLRDDRTILAVVKKYGSDGGQLVCFGSGYGIPGALMAVEGTLAANGWKVDKPWSPADK